LDPGAKVADQQRPDDRLLDDGRHGTLEEGAQAPVV
jgi:hypothetical protein